jgi:membrane-associated phospholipid phosphatase
MTHVRIPSRSSDPAGVAVAEAPAPEASGQDAAQTGAGLVPDLETVDEGDTGRRRNATLRRLSEYDRAASRLVGVRLPHPPRLTRVLGRISHAGDHGYIWYAMAAVPLIARRPRGGARFAYVAGGVLAAELANLVVKLAVRRERPSQAPEDGGCYITLPSTHSFPSAHATMGMVGLATMGRLYPRLKAPLTGLVALLAFTRAYLRVHYPADVVVGLGMGALVARIYTRLVRTPWPPPDAHANGRHS